MRPCHWCLPAIRNINLACRGLGLGTVITTSHILYESEVREILRLPDDVFTFALMPMDHPVEKYGPLSRRPVSQIAFAIDGANHGRFTAQRRGRASVLAVDLGCGHCAVMSEVVSPFPTTWLTCQQVAERLGLRSASAAASRARRAKWPRRIRNDTLEAEVCVPTEVLAAGPQEAPARRQPVHAENDGREAAEAVAAAVAPLRGDHREFVRRAEGGPRCQRHAAGASRDFPSRECGIEGQDRGT
jgi:hypothetical protein